MATHILTVNEDTFKVHLKYMFIGTGRNNFAHQNGALADIISAGARILENSCGPCIGMGQAPGTDGII